MISKILIGLTPPCLLYAYRRARYWKWFAEYNKLRRETTFINGVEHKFGKMVAEMGLKPWE